MSKNRIFSGVQPTGSLHLGNYLGAIRNWARLQDEFEAIYCVVDLHAVTAPHDPKELSRATREVTAGLIASGIDPKRSIIFNQSMVPEHAELSWLFNCIARLTITRGPGERGFGLSGREIPTVLITLHTHRTPQEKAITLSTTNIRVAKGDVLTTIKSNNKLNSVMAKYFAKEIQTNKLFLKYIERLLNIKLN